MSTVQENDGTHWALCWKNVMFIRETVRSVYQIKTQCNKSSWNYQQPGNDTGRINPSDIHQHSFPNSSINHQRQSTNSSNIHQYSYIVSFSHHSLGQMSIHQTFIRTHIWIHWSFTNSNLSISTHQIVNFQMWCPNPLTHLMVIVLNTQWHHSLWRSTTH